MFVKQISQPSFVQIKQIHGRFRLWIGPGIPRSFLVTLSSSEVEKLANHNYVVSTESSESLKAVFQWGFYSVMKLTQDQISELIDGRQTPDTVPE